VSGGGSGDNQVEAEKQVEVKVEVEKKQNRATPLSWPLPGIFVVETLLKIMLIHRDEGDAGDTT
jgi:hypothetical protein